MRLLCVTGPKIQMPEFASTNSRWKGEITLLEFETTVVSNFIGRGDPCTQWKKRCGASRLSGSFFANEVTRTHPRSGCILCRFFRRGFGSLALRGAGLG